MCEGMPHIEASGEQKKLIFDKPGRCRRNFTCSALFFLRRVKILLDFSRMGALEKQTEKWRPVRFGKRGAGLKSLLVVPWEGIKMEENRENLTAAGRWGEESGIQRPRSGNVWREKEKGRKFAGRKCLERGESGYNAEGNGKFECGFPEGRRAGSKMPDGISSLSCFVLYENGDKCASVGEPPRPLSPFSCIVHLY